MSFSRGAELDFSSDKSEEGMVFAHAYTFARKNVRAALADDNASWLRHITLGDFDPEVFWIGISAILCRPSGFFMCHGI